MKLRFGILLSFFVVSSLEASVLTPVQRAKERLKEGDAVGALLHLEAVSTRDPLFFESFVESQKIHYQQELWERFFGYQAYYHGRLAKNSETRSSKLLALEALALAKHCKWNEAEEVANAAVAMGKSGQNSEVNLQELLDHIRLHKEFPTALGSRYSSGLPKGAFQRLLYWKIEPERIQKVRHPRSLRMIVENSCKEKP